jgi:hypothetical protein
MPSIQESIGQPTDDAYSLRTFTENRTTNTAIAFYYFNNTVVRATQQVLGSLFFRHGGGLLYRGLRIPQAAVIDSAKIITNRTIATYGYIVEFKSPKWFADDVDDGDPGPGEYGWTTNNAPRHITKTQASEDVNFTLDITNPVEHDVTSIIQELVNRLGWDVGHGMRLVVTGGDTIVQTPGTSGFQTFRFAGYNFIPAGTLQAVLDITYTAAQYCIPPDALLLQDNLTGNVTDIQDLPDSPDANWLLTDTNGASDLRVSFPTPDSPPTTGIDLQTFRVLVRKDAAGGNDPGYSLELWEDGSSLEIVSTGAITTEDGIVIELPWDAVELGTADGSLVECRLVQTSGHTGNPSNRRYLEVGAVEWCVDSTVEEPPPPPEELPPSYPQEPPRRPRQTIGVADPDNRAVFRKPALSRAIAITPDDSEPLVNPSLAIEVDGAGDLVCKFEQSPDDVTLTLLAGVRYPLRLTHIRETDTTATGIKAFW